MVASHAAARSGACAAGPLSISDDPVADDDRVGVGGDSLRLAASRIAETHADRQRDMAPDLRQLANDSRNIEVARAGHALERETQYT
jgi:hypothetical protein